jgi:hypothetical protein
MTIATMTIEELNKIESHEKVKFALEPGGLFTVEGEDAAVDRALGQIDRNEIVALLRERDGSLEPIVKRIIPLNVLSKAAYRENYKRWYSAQSGYYHPTEAEEDRMFAAIEEGWEVLFDFAHSVTCRLPDGRLVAVNRKGKIDPPSPYSPHLAVKKP